MATTELQPLRFKSVTENAAQALRDAILNGKLKPGQRLVERHLAKSLGIGQPTLREALKELEYQGFVRKTPNKGTYVTKLSKTDFQKILKVRLALEVLAIEEAARRMNDETAKQLEDNVESMAVAAHRFNLAGFHKSDLAFHAKIWSVAGNEYLEIALERVVFSLFAFVLLQREPDSANEFLASVEQHRRILAGLRTADPEQAREDFLKSTLGFWNTYHKVDLSESA